MTSQKDNFNLNQIKCNIPLRNDKTATDTSRTKAHILLKAESHFSMNYSFKASIYLYILLGKDRNILHVFKED